MNVNFGVKLHNRFDAVLTDAKTGEVKQVAKAENVVLNQFFDIYWASYYTTTDLCLGTGTGTPKTTDTNLFNRVNTTSVGQGTRKRLSRTEWSKTYTYTYSENQVNYTLTEVGLAIDRAIDNYPLFTHAMFTDAEGNPISIIKTNSDRLTVTATVYLTLDWTKNNNGVYTNISTRGDLATACNPLIDYLPNDTYYANIIDTWLLCNDSFSPAITYSADTLPISNRNNFYIDASNSVTIDHTTLTKRLKAYNRILATSGNCKNPSTYLIRGISNNLAFVPLPNTQVYPPKLITLELVGDGATTDFNFAVPILNPVGVKVYINNTLQDSSTYTFNGNNYHHPQGWASYDTRYLSRYTSLGSPWSGSSNYGAATTFASRCDYYSGTSANRFDFCYDFTQEYRVSAVGRFLPRLYSDITRYATVPPKLYYSNDDTNWTELPLWSTINEYAAYPDVDQANSWYSTTPVSARYWKVTAPHINVIWTSEYMSAILLFGDPKPQLHFNTAPPADSTIKVEAYCDYPIKNENWIIENSVYFDYTFTRQ